MENNITAEQTVGDADSEPERKFRKKSVPKLHHRVPSITIGSLGPSGSSSVIKTPFDFVTNKGV